MHAVVDALQHHQHAIQRLLQFHAAGGLVAVLQQVLQQQLILGDPLNGLEEVGSERQLVAELLLAGREKLRLALYLLAQPLGPRDILAIITVQSKEHLALQTYKIRRISSMLSTSIYRAHLQECIERTHPLDEAQSDELGIRNAVLQVP